MPITFENLKKILEETGLVSEADLASVKEEAERTSRSVMNILIGRNYIAENYLAEVLSPYYGASIIDLKQVAIPQETLELIPETYAKSKSVVLFEKKTIKRKSASLPCLTRMITKPLNF